MDSKNSFANLLACAGTWNGLNRVQVSPSEPANESPSQLIVTPLLHDTFIRIDQTWSWKNQPQAGSMLIGLDPKSENATVHWIDTWHNGRNVMSLTGRFGPDGLLIVHGHFAVEGQSDWGWRIQIRAGGSRLGIDMFCVDPAGKDQGGVQGEFTPV